MASPSFLQTLRALSQLTQRMNKSNENSNNFDLCIKRVNNEPIPQQSMRHGTYDPQKKVMRFSPVSQASDKVDDCYTKQDLQKQQKLPEFVLAQASDNKQQISCTFSQKGNELNNKQQPQQISKGEKGKMEQFGEKADLNSFLDILGQICNFDQKLDKVDLSAEPTVQPKYPEQGEKVRISQLQDQNGQIFINNQAVSKEHAPVQQEEEQKQQKSVTDLVADEENVQAQQLQEQKQPTEVIDLTVTKAKVQKCIFFPFCKKQGQCKFLHPTEACKFFPKCRFGLSCKYTHPACKFGIGCTRLGCIYVHPKLPGPKPKNQRANINGSGLGQTMIPNSSWTNPQKKRFQNQKRK